MRAAVALSISPESDVYYYLGQAAQTLLSGSNPYTHLYAGIPSSLVTPGASRVFAYLPATAAYFIPFYLLWDVRAGTVFADLLIGICLYSFGGRWRWTCTLAFVFIPFTILLSTVYLNAGLVAIVFLAGALALEERKRSGLGAIALGLGLASLQFASLLLPFFAVYYQRKGAVTHLLLALLVGGAIIAPFLIASPGPFVNDVLSFQFGRTPMPLVSSGGPVGVLVNPSLSAITLAAFGFALSIYEKLVIEILLLLPLIRVRDLRSLLRSSFLFVLASVFVLPNDFFWAYLELPFVLFLFWLGSFGNT